jgi:hypothetical protein
VPDAAVEHVAAAAAGERILANAAGQRVAGVVAGDEIVEAVAAAFDGGSAGERQPLDRREAAQ